MVAIRERQAEEILAVLHRRPERDDNARDGAAVGFLQVAAQRGDIGVGQQVRHDALLQLLAPRRVVARDRRVVAQAEELAAQREERAVLIGIVNAEARLGHRPIGLDPRHRSGEPSIASGAGGDLGNAPGEIAERAGGDDGVEHRLAGRRAEEARLVVIALGGEVSVAAGEVEEGAILLQRFVAEGAEDDIAGAITLHDRSGALPEDFALGQQAGAVVDFLIHPLRRALELSRRSGDLEVGLDQLAIEELILVDDLRIFIGCVDGGERLLHVGLLLLLIHGDPLRCNREHTGRRF